MKIACYIKQRYLEDRSVIDGLLTQLREEGHLLTEVSAADEVPAGTDMLLSFGGDGTFLAAAAVAREAGVPILGVNLGRLGFLAEVQPEDVAEVLRSGNYTIEDRVILHAVHQGRCVTALNEMTLHRVGAGAIGVEVVVDGEVLPTCWADGMIVATSSGSTAYNLSVGGPVCTPHADVLVISPIAPHNLGVRPLVVPSSSEITLKLHSRGEGASLSADNTSVPVPDGTVITIAASSRPLKKVVTGRSGFVATLKSRFHWGEDVRNTQD